MKKLYKITLENELVFIQGFNEVQEFIKAPGIYAGARILKIEVMTVYKWFQQSEMRGYWFSHSLKGKLKMGSFML